MRSKNLFEQNICDVEIDYAQSWINKYKGRLEYAYNKQPFWNDLKEIVYPPLDKSFQKLTDLNIILINQICHYLGIETPTVLASEMACENLHGTALILKICTLSNANAYISGPDETNYLDSESFLKNGIKINYHNYIHPEYSQMGVNFIPHLSVLDLIDNCGDDSLLYLNTQLTK